MAVLSVRLREGTLVVRMGPKRYLEGLLTILKVRRTGTLHIDGWAPRILSPRMAWGWCSVRKPEYICLEDVRTFSMQDASELLGKDDTEMPNKEALGFRKLYRDRKAVLDQAWMPRETES